MGDKVKILETYLTSEQGFWLLCFVVAPFVIALDWCMLYFTSKSLLGITYAKNWWKTLLCWAFCSAVVGVFSTVLNFVKPNLQAAIFVSISWQALAKRVFTTANAPSQPSVEEEK